MKIVLTTCPSRNSKKITDKILKEKLAACALEIDSKSSYWWGKSICKDEKEKLIIFKTSEKLSKKLMERIKEIHPYSTPFISIIDLEKVNVEYEKWLEDVLGG